MMKTITKCILVLALVGALTSCKKWLDLKPQDGIVGNEFWNTKEQVDAAVIGIYASMLGPTTAGERALPEYFFLWGEARTDMVIPGFRADQDEQDIVNLNMLPTNKFANWRAFYQTINYCNTLVQLAPGVLELDKTATKANIDRAVAEALALRALMYFYLARSFGDVPLKLDATLSDEDIKPLAKSPQIAVLNQIVADLQKAKLSLPNSFGNSLIDKGRVTRYAANAMLADVYLWMDRYTECVAECDTLIRSGNFGLIPGVNLFQQVFFEGNSSESIFELQYDAQKTNPFFNMHTSGNKRWGGAINLTDEVYGVDVVNAVPNIDWRGNNTSYRGTDFTIWKYVGADNNGSAFRTFDQSTANWIFYRYADILLMKAEAINQLDQPAAAWQLVKVIRDRASAVTFMPIDSTTKGGMTTFILEERQREFAYEGKRWYDVLRNAKRNNYALLSLLLNMAANSLAPDRQQAAFAKLRDKNSHYFPIYFYELQTNKLLEQNPFYK